MSVDAELVAWVICLSAAIVGLVTRDVRTHGITLAVSLVALLFRFLHHR